MSAQTVLEDLKNQGIELVAKDGKLLSRPPIPDELLPAVKEHKEELIEALRGQQGKATTASTTDQASQEIRAALTRLAAGECESVRLHSRTAGETFS